MVKSREHVRSQIQGLNAAGHSISSIVTIVQCNRKTVRDAKKTSRLTKVRQNKRIRTSDPSLLKPEMRLKFPFKIMVAGGISRYVKTELYVVTMGETVNGKHNRENILPIYTKIINNRHVFPRTDTVCLSLCKMEQLVISLEQR